MTPRLENGGPVAPDLCVALVNNMPDAALEATERQFARLVSDSRGELTVRMDLYALSSVPRSFATRRAMASRYGALADLIAAPPDALIVTGGAPRAAELVDEPYWAELMRLIDWAHSGAIVATLYSCLAAHAAVLVADGVRRRRLPAKLCGVYGVEVVQRHELTEGLASPLIPHSRYNGLDAHELADYGYSILTYSKTTGVDYFVKEGATLEAFWQGHPEYEADTLARELRRDWRSFLAGAPPPPLPENYLSPLAYARIKTDLAYIAQGRAAPAPLSPLASLVPETASWIQTSRPLMGAFLAAAQRRQRRRDALAHVAKAPFAEQSVLASLVVARSRLG